MLDRELRRQVTAESKAKARALFSYWDPERIGIIGFTLTWPLRLILEPLAETAFQFQAYRAIKRGKAPHPQEG
jgi:hypothetical protein